MALGGGTFLVQNKRLPGAYINTVSVAAASATLSDRGYAALPLEMGWGPQGEIFTVEQGDFLKNSQTLFGYSYTAAALRPMREASPKPCGTLSALDTASTRMILSRAFKHPAFSFSR